MALLPTWVYRYRFILLLGLLWFASLYIVFQLVPAHDGDSSVPQVLSSQSRDYDRTSSSSSSKRGYEDSSAKNTQVNLRSSSRKRGYKRNITIWSSDFHISPVADLKHLLAPLGVQFIDQSLSSHCYLTNTCQDRLRVIDSLNGLELLPCANDMRHDFYLEYKDDEYFNSADAILCTHACSMCELFMPFGKPLIVIASTRYEIGRYDRPRWLEWNDNLQRIARRPGNVVGANNMYDLEYMKYFTNLGSEEVKLMPSYCGYVSATYAPTRDEVLIAPGRGTDDRIVARVVSIGEKSGHKIAPLREMYPHYEFSDLAAHKAFILLPYQVSFMLFFELYRMAIPMFVPGPKLLSRWHLKRNVLHERTWSGAHGARSYHSAIGRNVDSKSSLMLDPNDDTSFDAIYEWVQLSDFYQFPHVQQFESLDHLIELLGSADLASISSSMMEFNEKQKASIVRVWEGIVDDIRSRTEQNTVSLSSLTDISGNIIDSIMPPHDDPFNAALQKEYGAMLSPDSCIGEIDPSSKASRLHSSTNISISELISYWLNSLWGLLFVSSGDAIFYVFVGVGLVFIVYSVLYL